MSDYDDFLLEYGLTEDYVQSLTQNKLDQIPLPDGFVLLVKESPINGVGGFADCDIPEHSLIAPARINGMRTPAGRYINHSATPNAQFFQLPNGDLDLISTFAISEGDEITIDYRQAISVNGSGLKPIYQFPSLINKSGINVSGMTNRQKIDVAQWVLKNNYVNIADDMPVRNFIHAGMYARELTINAGIALTGKIHLEPHLCIISSGDISIMTDNGMTRIKAPYTFEASAGIKKLGYAHETTVFTTIHATELTDINELEAALLDDGNIDWINELMSGDIICQQ
jgi:hypothetical protein